MRTEVWPEQAAPARGRWGWARRALTLCVALAALLAAAGGARANDLGDIDGDCIVGPKDLAILLASWGPCAPNDPFCLSDLNGDRVVNAPDLALLLGNWGQKCATVRVLNCPDVICTGSTYTFEAQDESPPGGTYAWTIMQPGAQLSVVGAANQALFTVMADNPSGAREDITVKCVYTRGDFSAEATCKVTSVQLRVVAIKFDYKGPNTDSGDALNIRASLKDDLKHEGNGKGDGEWLKPFGAAAPTRNEPALYIAGVQPRLQAKFEVRPKSIPSLFVGAYATGGIFAGIITEPVNFDANGVSDAGGGNAYVEFQYAVASPMQVSKGVGNFEWTVEQFIGPIPTSQECTADITGPHTLYHVLDTPQSPWYDTGKQHPWVSALDFAIATAGADGKTTLTDAVGAVTTYIHSRNGGLFGLCYDVGGGRTTYIGKLTLAKAEFDLTKFMTKAKGPRVNCHDVACAVASLGALTGAPMQYLYMGKFGYINPTFLIGKQGNANPPGSVDTNPADSVNNPFPKGTTPLNTGNNNDNDSLADPHDRRSYGTHGFTEIMNATVGMERIFDACVGPHLGAESRAMYVMDGIDRLPAGGPEDMVAGATTDIRVIGKVVIDFSK